jgi:hypothetical protein
MMRGSRLWVMAMPLPAQAPHCMLTAAQPGRANSRVHCVIQTMLGRLSITTYDLEKKQLLPSCLPWAALALAHAHSEALADA